MQCIVKIGLVTGIFIPNYQSLLFKLAETTCQHSTFNVMLSVEKKLCYITKPYGNSGVVYDRDPSTRSGKLKQD